MTSYFVKIYIFLSVWLHEILNVCYSPWCWNCLQYLEKIIYILFKKTFGDFTEVLQQIIKNILINKSTVILTLELIGNIFFILDVDHRTPHIAFKSLSNYLWLRLWKILNYFRYPAEHFFSAEEPVSLEDAPNATLHSASGGKINILTCFLVFSLMEPSFFSLLLWNQGSIAIIFRSDLFSRILEFLWWLTEINLKFFLSQINVV